MLLRYNGRHSLWFPRGYKNQWMPQLNPTESCSHGKNRKRTFRFYEPQWLWQLRQRLFCFAGKLKCQGQFDAIWRMGPDGNRTCSSCGSIHPEDLMKICRRTLEDEHHAVEGSTKGYKYYIRQPGVRNAGEGAIKFYMWHAPANPSRADQDLFGEAVRVTRERFMKQLQAR